MSTLPPPQRFLSPQGWPIFILEFQKIEDHCAEIKVFEVGAWTEEKEPIQTEKRLYLMAQIKWDGCSHVWFGEQDESEKQDGYLHLCGVEQWQAHARLMEWIYKTATPLISHMDTSELWK